MMQEIEELAEKIVSFIHFKPVSKKEKNKYCNSVINFLIHEM
jgi:hypothetical protein